MKTLSVTEVARNFRAVLDRVEHQQEEILLIRNRRQVAGRVAQPPHPNPQGGVGAQFRPRQDRPAAARAGAVSAARKSRRGRLSELRNPWAG